MSTIFKHLWPAPRRGDPYTITIEPARNGFHITEFQIATQYKASYVARDLGELAQVIQQICAGTTEGES